MPTTLSAFSKENLHIIGDTDLLSSDTNHYGYQPLAKGGCIPAFSLPSEAGIINALAPLLKRETLITLQDFLDYQQPLVIAFLGAPGQAAADILKLEKLGTGIQQCGGRLLVLTAIAPRHLRRQLRQSDTFTLFYDKDNTIAELFGLYDPQNPLWQWVSGIEEEEQVLPALYVAAPDRNITFSYVDYHFSLFTGSMQHWHAGLLNAVQAVANQYCYQQATYRRVS